MRINHVTLETSLPRVWRKTTKIGSPFLTINNSKPLDNSDWRLLYRAALAEIDKTKLLERIAEAEKAIVLRARELFHGRGDRSSDNGEETGALDQVMYALHALRSQFLKSSECYR